MAPKKNSSSGAPPEDAAVADSGATDAVGQGSLEPVERALADLYGPSYRDLTAEGIQHALIGARRRNSAQGET